MNRVSADVGFKTYPFGILRKGEIEAEPKITGYDW